MLVGTEQRQACPKLFEIQRGGLYPDSDLTTCSAWLACSALQHISA